MDLLSSFCWGENCVFNMLPGRNSKSLTTLTYIMLKDIIHAKHTDIDHVAMFISTFSLCKTRHDTCIICQVRDHRECVLMCNLIAYISLTILSIALINFITFASLQIQEERPYFFPFFFSFFVTT